MHIHLSLSLLQCLSSFTWRPAKEKSMMKDRQYAVDGQRFPVLVAAMRIRRGFLLSASVPCRYKQSGSETLTRTMQHLPTRSRSQSCPLLNRALCQF